MFLGQRSKEFAGQDSRRAGHREEVCPAAKKVERFVICINAAYLVILFKHCGRPGAGCCHADPALISVSGPET